MIAFSTAISRITTEQPTPTGAPGKGKIDWQAVLVALKDVGYNGVISIELEDVPGVSRRMPIPSGAVRSAENAS